MTGEWGQFLSVGLEPIYYLINPQKRIFWLYLVSSVCLALGLVILRRGDLLASIRKAVALKLWLHPSSRVDFCWFFFNHVFRVLIIVPVLGGGLAFALSLNRFFSEWMGRGDFWHLPEWSVGILFTGILFVAEDFSRFLIHFSYHKIPVLWRFHGIHHSATVLTPMTLYRLHWVELIINSVRSLLVIGVVTGLFIYCFDNTIRPITVLGATFTSFLFNFVGANLRHSDVWLGFGWFERWVVSPAQHQIHHSIAYEHRDKNFGASLAIWDRLFGSLVLSRETKVEGYGLGGNEIKQRFISQQKGV